MEIVSHEAHAWMRAAEVAGVELPADVIEAQKRLEELEAETAALAQPVEMPNPAALAAGGTPTTEAVETVERLKAEEAKRAEAYRVSAQAQDVARGTISRLVAERRDELVIGMRPILARIIDEACPLVTILEPFAPKYDAGAILRQATPKQVAAFRKADELEAKFGTVMAAWRSSFQDATRQGGYASPSHVPGFDTRWVDQVHRYWARPEFVQNPRLNGTHLNERGYPSAIQPTVLAVAAEAPECEFRLCTVRELKDAYEAAELARLDAAREQVQFRRMRAV